jgi:hypothetical protein
LRGTQRRGNVRVGRLARPCISPVITQPSKLTVYYLWFTITLHTHHTEVAVCRQAKFRRCRGYSWPQTGDDKTLRNKGLQEDTGVLNRLPATDYRQPSKEPQMNADGR